MPDLGDQIRTYVDGTSDPITPDEVYNRQAGDDKVRTFAQAPDRRRVGTGVLITATTALIVVLAVTITLLADRGDDVSSAGEPAPSTSTATPTTTTVTPTTATIERPAPTAVPQVTEGGVVSSDVPGLGEITWTKVVGDENSLPRGTFDYVDGRYVAFDEGGQWVSSDAVTWSFEEAGPGRDHVYIEQHGDWAVGATAPGDGDLLRRDGSDWVRVALPPAPAPDVGVEWSRGPRIPVRSGKALLVDATAWGRIDWGEVFGEFEVDCGVPEPCMSQPYSVWDDVAEVLYVSHPETGVPLTTAEIRVTGEEVQFVDRGSGELLHAIAAGPDYPVTRIVDQIRRNEGFVHPGGFVSRDDGATWSWVDFPWELPTTYVLAVPDGGFASFVVDYRWQENPAIAEFSVWTSNDGESWVDRGIPGFPMSAVRYVDLEASSADRLIATVVTDFDPQTGLEEGIAYVSTDALTWEALDIPVAPGSRAYRTNFGEVIASPLSSRRPFWVSVDGGSDWTPIDGPSSRPIEGYDVAGAAGDVMYVGFGAYPDGPRTLWIGTFGP